MTVVCICIIFHYSWKRWKLFPYAEKQFKEQSFIPLFKYNNTWLFFLLYNTIAIVVRSVAYMIKQIVQYYDMFDRYGVSSTIGVDIQYCYYHAVCADTS